VLTSTIGTVDAGSKCRTSRKPLRSRDEHPDRGGTFGTAIPHRE
jgi:hypothetical protein